MALSPQDEVFVTFAARTRRTLGGCALLLTGDPGRARRLTETVLARRYRAAGPAEQQAAAALAELVRPQPGFFRPPWAREPGLELVDAGVARRVPLLEELQRLAPEPRASLVLGQYAGLPAPAVAQALRTDEPTVEQWVQQAYRTLSTGRPERLQPGRLAAELRAVVDGHLDEGPAGADPPALADLQHGRQLARGRRLRRGSALVAAVLVLVVVVSTVLTREAPVPRASSTPEPTTSTTPSPVPHVAASCDVRNGVCQATVMRAWRTEMSRVAASYVDPDATYFTGYSFSYTPRYESRSFWAGKGGALGLEMFRLKGGATEVYLQVASDYRSAVRCGELTGRRCVSQRFMDGNRFTLTSSTSVKQGMEVQYRPDGDQVVTVVARNTTGGQRLDVSRAQLLALVQDPRLRLPEI